jgi:hypothetical protein
MVKVSGVPYDVDLPKFNEAESLEDMIATLEHENRCLRARTERLEEELLVANQLLTKQNIELINMRHDLLTKKV